MRKLSAAVLVLFVLLAASCVYTGRGDVSLIQRMGEAGTVVVTADALSLMDSGLAAYVPSALAEHAGRADRVSLSLDADGSVSGLVHGALSSTEVGTVLAWDPSFRRVKDSAPRYYRNAERGIEAGVPEEGILLFTNASYEAELERLEHGKKYIPDDCFALMEASLGGLYAKGPLSLPLSDDIPPETARKVRSLLLLVNEGDGDLLVSGVAEMDSEESARALCIVLRNLLVQEVRRNGERLDVKALSGIFTYEGSSLRIDGYEAGYDEVGSMLTKELRYAAL